MQNLRAILLMILGMAGFAIEDLCIKLMANAGMSVGAIMIVLAILGGFVFLLIAKSQGAQFFSPIFWTRPVIIRNLCEAAGAIGFMTAIAFSDISVASAILQAAPLLVTLGGALFLGEAVGWRRMLAIIAGLIGVLIIIRPGFDGFDPMSLFAVLGVLCLSARDVATRALPKSASSTMLSVYAFWALIPVGIIYHNIQGHSAPFEVADILWPTIAAIVSGVIAYYALIVSMRIGETAVVTPFRYTRLIFAMIIGIVVFGERPDIWTYIGALIVIGSGLFTLWRERQLAQRIAAQKA